MTIMVPDRSLTPSTLRVYDDHSFSETSGGTVLNDLDLVIKLLSRKNEDSYTGHLYVYIQAVPEKSCIRHFYSRI